MRTEPHSRINLSICQISGGGGEGWYEGGRGGGSDPYLCWLFDLFRSMLCLKLRWENLLRNLENFWTKFVYVESKEYGIHIGGVGPNEVKVYRVMMYANPLQFYRP